MPSKLFDHHTDHHHDHDFLHLHRKKAKEITGFRRPPNTNRVRRNSTSGPDDHETGRSAKFSTTETSSSSSTSNSTSLPRPRYENKPRNRGSMSTGALSTLMKNADFNKPPPPPAAATSLRHKHPVEPSSQIQEWAHQMHIKQERKYWWCMACNPKSPSLQVPSQTAMKRVRNTEPTHAYE